MTSKSSVLISLFLLITLFSFAQDSTNNKPNTIYYQKGIKFTINGQSLRIDDSIEIYLNKNTNAFNEYKIYRRNVHASRLFVSLWLANWIAAATQIGHKNNLTLDFGLSGLVSLFIGTPFYTKAIKHLKKGICYYNQQFGF
jgi:hypothetical protein